MAEHSLREHMRFEQRVVRADYSSASARWRLQTAGGALYTCGFLMMCSGYYDYDAPYGSPPLPDAACRAAACRAAVSCRRLLPLPLALVLAGSVGSRVRAASDARRVTGPPRMRAGRHTPAFAGSERFQGRIVHPQHWPVWIQTHPGLCGARS